MGTVAEKLTYLNGTKSSLKTAINNLGGDIDNNTTFRNYANVLNDIYDNLPKVSDTGTSVSLNPTLKGRLGIVPKGNTLQDGEPTPSTPVEIQSATGTQKVVVSGKNLMPYNTYDANDNRVLSTPDLILNSGTYTISFDLESQALGSNSSYSVVMGVYFEDSTATDITLLMVDSSTTLGRKNVTFTLNKNVVSNSQANIRIGLTYYNNGARVILNNIKITKEEPQEVDIELSSKNLFDKNNTTDGYFMSNSTGKLQTNARFCVSNKINVKPNTQYYINSNINRHLCYFDKENNFISGLPIASIFTKGLITTPSNASYMYYSPSIEDKNTLQIVEGTEAPETYIPYYNYTPNKIGDYEDYIGGTPDNWVLYKKTREISLNISDMNNAEDYPGWKNVQYIKNDYPNNNNPLNYLCDYKSNINISTNEGIGINTNSNNATLQLRKAVFNLTQTQWKQQYPNLTFKLVYGLQEYDQTPITEENLISQLNELYYLQSYNSTTNIDVAGNLPMRITASAIKGA